MRAPRSAGCRSRARVCLMLKDPAILECTLDDTQRRALRELARRVRATLGEDLDRIVLYGSRARGDAGPDSDIDVLIITGTEPAPACRSRLSAIAADLQVETATYLPFSLAVMSRAAYAALLGHERRFALDVESEGVDL